jgi:predicted SnoaL-like aldol condensation-catalyzing enzyme
MKRVIATAALALALAGGGSPARAQQAATEAQNKKIVLEFYDKVLNGRQSEAVASYLGPHYIQHNPLVADGVEGFRKFIEFLRQNYPQAHSEQKHVFADGDYVIVHSRAIREPGTRGTAIVDIFRLENQKIVEHWDVIQPVPETAANSNGMF